MKNVFLFLTMLVAAQPMFAQGFRQSVKDSVVTDTSITYSIQLPEVPIVQWKNRDEQLEYFKTLARVRKVMPYVKIAKQIYVDLEIKKANEKKKQYRTYRKDTEKEMRGIFEKELKNLSVGQGKVLVKLINRETGNNCYDIIKDVKGGFAAWGWQIIAKHYDYNLKENYDPKKEWMIELAIKQLGKEYNISTAYDNKK
ncbi:MAG TPA: DUF4294 domain-containing protein [Chitinophagales bacterium]